MIKLKRDRRRGQALVEGAVSLVIIVALMIGGILVILGSYFALTYKTKLAYAVAEGAKASTNYGYFLGAKRKDYSDAQLVMMARDKVNNALVAFGLSAAKPGNLAIAMVTRNGVEGVQVDLKHDQLGVISGGLLPANITLSERAFYPLRNVTPTAVLGMSIGGTSDFPNGQGLFLPMYGGGAVGRGNPNGTSTQGPVPSGTFRTWKIAITGEIIPPINWADNPSVLDSPPTNVPAISRTEKYGTKESLTPKQ
ncbi:MAG: hypothetical protein K2W82_15185 [Candidatus Obscuribacterales bacterium]|nr:hypothetical protein [Candidatus Obscuribacterales bacterium]